MRMHPHLRREEGNALLVSLILLTLLLGLATAQSAVQRRNLEQSRFFTARKFLHKYAEAGVARGVHQVRNDISTNPGYVGTASWTLLDDVGRDGQSATGDEGEGDDLPTPGEPNVAPVAIGSAAHGARYIVYVKDTSSLTVQRVIATAVNADGMVTVEKHVRRHPVTVPRTSALFVNPNTTLDLNGGSFTVNGNNHDINGNLDTSQPPLYGLATAEGDNPGNNASNLLSQIPGNMYDQFLGKDGEPSVGESDPVDMAGLQEQLGDLSTNDVAPGTYSSPTFGSTSTPEITHVSGDLILSGNSSGGGILVVDGNLEVTGQFEFTGFVIAGDDVVLTGGGGGTHIIGGLAAGDMITDDNTTDDTTVSGTADVDYSSEALDMAQQLIQNAATYEGFYYDEERSTT